MYYILPVFLAYSTCMNFFGQWTKHAGFFSFLYALPGYTEYTFFVPVIRNYNISGQMHVLCIRNFVTYAELMQTGGLYWKLEDFELWDSLISQATTAYSDLFCTASASLCLQIIGDERLQVN